MKSNSPWFGSGVGQLKRIVSWKWGKLYLQDYLKEISVSRFDVHDGSAWLRSITRCQLQGWGPCSQVSCLLPCVREWANQSDAVKTAVSSPRSHAMDSTRKRIMAIFFDLLTSAWSAGEIADNSCELVRCYHFDNWSREWSLNNSCSHWGFFFMFVHQI